MVQSGVILPKLGDIWSDHNGECYLILSEPKWEFSVVKMRCIHLNTGHFLNKIFPIDPATGTVYDWYTKVA